MYMCVLMVCVCVEGVEANAALEDDAHHYHKLVVLDILESERSFVHDLNVCMF